MPTRSGHIPLTIERAGLALGLSLCLVAGVGTGLPASAWAQPAPAEKTAEKVVAKDMQEAMAQDPQGGLPEEAKDLRIDEKVGSQVPLDISFVDTHGQTVTLAEYLKGDLPVILTFNYSSCPMLCNAHLSAFVEAMNKLVFVPGEQFRVVTVAIDHLETPDIAGDTQARYYGQFPETKRASVSQGWQRLTGTEKNIRALADSVGFPFRYLEKDKEYAHPATLIFLSPTGIVTRYYHGIYYEPTVLSKSIFQAAVGQHGVSVGFLLACLRPTHKQGYADTGFAVMRYGGISFVLFLLAAFGTWQMIRARNARQEQT